MNPTTPVTRFTPSEATLARNGSTLRMVTRMLNIERRPAITRMTPRMRSSQRIILLAAFSDSNIDSWECSPILRTIRLLPFLCL